MALSYIRGKSAFQALLRERAKIVHHEGDGGQGGQHVRDGLGELNAKNPARGIEPEKQGNEVHAGAQQRQVRSSEESYW